MFILPKKHGLPISIRLSISIGSITLIAILIPMITLSGMIRRKKQLNPRRNWLRDIANPYNVRKVFIQCIQTIGCETVCKNYSGDLIEIASIVRFTETISIRITFGSISWRLLYLFRWSHIQAWYEKMHEYPKTHC